MESEVDVDADVETPTSIRHTEPIASETSSSIQTMAHLSIALHNKDLHHAYICFFPWCRNGNIHYLDIIL